MGTALVAGHCKALMCYKINESSYSKTRHHCVILLLYLSAGLFHCGRL